MDAWIALTFVAAFAQTLRFMAQRHLSATALSTGGATFARFVYSAPLVMVLVLVYAAASGQAVPATNHTFWAYAAAGGLAQVLATMCVVALFRRRNFAVGITFKKTEVLQTALVSYVVLGEGVGATGLTAILVGFAGVLLLSETPGAGRLLARMATPSTGLGLLSGIFFAVSAVGYRGASLALASGDVALRAGWTLAMVTAGQVLGLGAWLAWRERGQIMATLRAWRIAALVGLASMVGSFCWFSAFTLQNVAYVNAVGQVELIFSLAASVLVFGERLTGREGAGMALLAVSVLALILTG